MPYHLFSFGENEQHFYGRNIPSATTSISDPQQHRSSSCRTDMASDKTLYAIHRRRGWPYSSVKQMKEGEMDATFLAYCGRKRKTKKQDKTRSRSGSEKCPRRASSKCNITCGPRQARQYELPQGLRLGQDRPCTLAHCQSRPQCP